VLNFHKLSVHIFQEAKKRMGAKTMCLIAAVERNLGLGRNNDLPWQLEQEYAYFNRLTTLTQDTSKMVIISTAESLRMPTS
jgi:dihydrofolate reductase